MFWNLSFRVLQAKQKTATTWLNIAITIVKHISLIVNSACKVDILLYLLSLWGTECCQLLCSDLLISTSQAWIWKSLSLTMRVSGSLGFYHSVPLLLSPYNVGSHICIQATVNFCLCDWHIFPDSYIETAIANCSCCYY